MATVRLHDSSGRQIVQVAGRYAYVWDGEAPLEVGDQVELPATWASPNGWFAEVTGMGTTYNGSLASVRGVRRKA